VAGPSSAGLDSWAGGDMLACARITRVRRGFKVEIRIGKLSISIEIS